MTKTSRLNFWKVLLDLAMTVGFLALMEPKATGLSLHEWGGLAIALFFFLHIALNGRWVKAVSAAFFRPGLRASVRLGYVVDVLLLVGFGLILFSGMAIAKTIDFTWLLGPLHGGPWRGLHLVASLLILLAVGLHIGLHADWIRARFGARSVQPAPRASEPLALVLMFLAVGLGVVGLIETGFLPNLVRGASMAFSPEAMVQSRGAGGHRGGPGAAGAAGAGWIKVLWYGTVLVLAATLTALAASGLRRLRSRRSTGSGPAVSRNP